MVHNEDMFHKVLQFFSKPPVDGPEATLLIRLMAGSVFFWEGLWEGYSLPVVFAGSRLRPGNDSFGHPESGKSRSSWRNASGVGSA